MRRKFEYEANSLGGEIKREIAFGLSPLILLQPGVPLFAGRARGPYRSRKRLSLRLKRTLISVVACHKLSEQAACGAVVPRFGERYVIGRSKRRRERGPGMDGAGPAHIFRPVPIK